MTLSSCGSKAPKTPPGPGPEVALCGAENNSLVNGKRLKVGFCVKGLPKVTHFGDADPIGWFLTTQARVDVMFSQRPYVAFFEKMTCDQQVEFEILLHRNYGAGITFINVSSDCPIVKNGQP